MARPQQLIVILSAFWITTQCLADYYSPANYDQYYQVPAYYQYSWEVKDLPSGNDYRQQETRDGHLTTGLYQVLLPGGRHQTVNYRVDKDSGFMADVSYQGENNYFTFKNAPAPPQAYNYPSQPAAGPYNPSPYYPSKQPAYSGYNSAVQQKPEEQSYYYPSADQRPSYRNPAVPDYPTRNKYGFDDEPAFYPDRTTTTTTTTAAPVKVTTTEAAVTTTVKAAQEEEVVEYGNKPDYSVPMYPLYRADFYSARAKSGKTVTEPQSSTVATSSSGYGVDEEGYTYIKPSAKYSVPDKLGAGYEVNHRKATMRKPTYSDYQAPEALQI
ncbi:uncharacterized protein LOC124198538 isoform X2 [Daphnia pulex]|uniref:uncharacterized protein LOC124198538 isoform X2 n=1 Tax=Daphnia pulex TaxID=6669 RepID=UPI001EE0F910|nr:uncharacterized protein LOC124198538 isoform X2 [Daphnia pulex]